MPTTNADMNSAIRKKRGELDDYMYGGPGSDTAAPDAAVVIAAAPDEEAAETTPDNEVAEGDTTGIEVLDPGQPDPEDKYVYAPGSTPGSWTMYPPGVPCDSQETRVALDHPATPADLAKMEQAVGGSSTMAAAEPTAGAPLQEREGY